MGRCVDGAMQTRWSLLTQAVSNMRQCELERVYLSVCEESTNSGELPAPASQLGPPMPCQVTPVYSERLCYTTLGEINTTLLDQKQVVHYTKTFDMVWTSHMHAKHVPPTRPGYHNPFRQPRPIMALSPSRYHV
jgi:hypothetical protein